MSPRRTVKCITCMNQAVISNLWESLAFSAQCWLAMESWVFKSPQEHPVLFLIHVLNTALQPDCTCVHPLSFFYWKVSLSSTAVVLNQNLWGFFSPFCLVFHQNFSRCTSSDQCRLQITTIKQALLCFWIQETKLTLNFQQSLQQPLKPALCERSKNTEDFLDALYILGRSEVRMLHQASVQQPNLLAAIDIPFPLSLLSCFAFRGFALSQECPGCGLRSWRQTALLHNHYWVLYYPGKDRIARTTLEAFHSWHLNCASVILCWIWTNLAIAVKFLMH